MAHPHFVDRSRLTVQLAEAIDAGEGDVAYWTYVNPTGKNKELAPIYPADNPTADLGIPEYSFQMMASPPNGQHTLTFLNQDDVVTVQCTGFCEQIRIYKDEAAYLASQKPIDIGTRARELMGGILAFKHQLNKPVYLGAQRFMSYAFMNPDDDSDNSPAIEANIAGIVQASHQFINPLTGKPYYWALLLSADDQLFDITMAPNECDLPQPGNVIDGTFWVSARFFSPSEKTSHNYFPELTGISDTIPKEKSSAVF